MGSEKLYDMSLHGAERGRRLSDGPGTLIVAAAAVIVSFVTMFVLVKQGADLSRMEAQLSHLKEKETHLRETETRLKEMESQLSHLKEMEAQLSHLKEMEAQLAHLKEMEAQLAHLKEMEAQLKAQMQEMQQWKEHLDVQVSQQGPGPDGREDGKSATFLYGDEVHHRSKRSASNTGNFPNKITVPTALGAVWLGTEGNPEGTAETVFPALLVLQARLDLQALLAQQGRLDTPAPLAPPARPGLQARILNQKTVISHISQCCCSTPTSNPPTTSPSPLTTTRPGSGKITFPGPRGTEDYARMNTILSDDLTSFTLCVHMRSNMDSSDSISLVSYAVQQDNNELVLFLHGSLQLVLQTGPGVDMADPPVWDGEWHTICTTWRSSDGAWQLYVDGVLTASGSGFRVGGRVRAGGTLIIGQEQDVVGGGFDANQSFIGDLSEVHLWDNVLSPAEIAADCSYHGNVIDWDTTNIDVFGQASKAEYHCDPLICRASRKVASLAHVAAPYLRTATWQASPQLYTLPTANWD
ncbi:hypothetical protein Bbelb_007500 [Branchiostoma belcheri]|nr:hypothetical protein Bbelb_007500 [Branchiostoma belcheri]